MAIEISKRLVLINSTSAMIARLLNLTVIVWLFQYLIKNVSPQEFRVYAVVSAAVLFLPLLIMAVSGGFERFVAEAYSRGDRRRVTQITSTMAPIFLGIGLFVLVAGSAFAWNIDRVLTIPIEPDTPDPLRLRQDARLMFLAMVVSIFIRISFMPFMVGLQVRQKHVWAHVIDLGAQVVWMGTLFGLMFGVGPRALWVPVATVPQSLFNVTVILIVSRRVLPELRFRWSEMRREIVRPMMAFGGWTMAGRISAVARVAAGPMILNEIPMARDPDAEVGTFKTGQLVDTRLLPLALVPLSTTLPMLTAMHATGQTDRLRRTYFRFCRYLLWAFMFAAVPLIAYREELWRLYLEPKDFARLHHVTTVMTLLLVRSVVMFPQPVLAQLVGALNMTRPMAIRVVSIEALTVLAVVLAVNVWDAGAIGAAVAMVVVAGVLQPLFNWTLGLQLTEGTWGSWFRRTVMPGLLPTLVAFPACLGLRQLFVPESWLTLGLSAALGCAVYLGTILLFCLEPSERQDVAKILTKMRSFIPKRADA